MHQPPRSTTPVRPNAWAAVFLLAAAGLCVFLYYPGLSGGFLFDDVHTVKNNPWIVVDSLGIDALVKAAESFAVGGRELPMLSFALNAYFLGHDPFAYKAVNLGIHLLVGVLTYLLTRTLVVRLTPAGELAVNPILRRMPEIVTLIWMVSPINLTSVLYVSQRMTSMSALFVFAALLLYVRARVRFLESGRYSWISWLLVPVCLLAAWNSKENGLLLVPLVLLVEVVVFSFKGRDGKVNGVLVSVLALLFAGAAFFAALLIDFDFSRLVDGYAYRPFTLEERLLTQARLLVFYIGLVLFPLVGRFGLWHDDIAISTSLLSPVDTVTSILLLLLLVLIALSVRRRYPLCTLGVLWFFIGHSMESSILPLEMVHEHRNYLPAYGVVLTVVAFLGYLGSVRLSFKAVLLVVLAAAASFNLYVRAAAWSDELGHAVHEYTNHPTSPRATFILGAATLRLAEHGVDGAGEAGFELMERARELGDDTILPEVAMIQAASVLGRPIERKWVEDAAGELRDSPVSNSDVLALRGLRECIAEGACRLEPEIVRPVYDAAAQTSYGLAIEEAARFFNRIGDSRAAMAALARAARHSGIHVEIRLNYIWSLIENGLLDEAREQIRIIDERGIELPRGNRDRLDRARQRLAGAPPDEG